jgi:hypothetical protein
MNLSESADSCRPRIQVRVRLIGDPIQSTDAAGHTNHDAANPFALAADLTFN